MAKTKICPNCGKENPVANLFCEDCGVNIDSIPPNPVPGGESGYRCPNGHIVSDPTFEFCNICGERMPRYSPTPTPPPPAPVPGPTVICPKCGAMNPAENIFCQNCSASMSEKPSPIGDIPVVSVPIETPPFIPAIVGGERELPDIPDIMRTLNDDDMKR